VDVVYVSDGYLSEYELGESGKSPFIVHLDPADGTIVEP
jgi:hypothetical protein